MKKPSFLILTFLIFAIGCKDSLSPNITIISPEEMQSFLQMDKVQLIDVRSKEDYDTGYILGAKNIDLLSPTFQESIDKLDKEKPVFVYCNTGKRSLKCAQKLVEAGFVKIYDLDGGISKWKLEGLKIKNEAEVK